MSMKNRLALRVGAAVIVSSIKIRDVIEQALNVGWPGSGSNPENCL
jgi:hypothetical protein